jgi:hypothetical protein
MSNGYSQERIAEILADTETKLVSAFKKHYEYIYKCDVKVIHIPHIEDPKSYDRSVCNQVISAANSAKTWAEVFEINDLFMEVKELPTIGEDGEYSHTERYMLFVLRTDNDTTRTRKTYDKLMYLGGSALDCRIEMTTTTIKLRD